MEYRKLYLQVLLRSYPINRSTTCRAYFCGLTLSPFEIYTLCEEAHIVWHLFRIPLACQWVHLLRSTGQYRAWYENIYSILFWGRGGRGVRSGCLNVAPRGDKRANYAILWTWLMRRLGGGALWCPESCRWGPLVQVHHRFLCLSRVFTGVFVVDIFKPTGDSLFLSDSEFRVRQKTSLVWVA